MTWHEQDKVSVWPEGRALCWALLPHAGPRNARGKHKGKELIVMQGNIEIWDYKEVFKEFLRITFYEKHVHEFWNISAQDKLVFISFVSFLRYFYFIVKGEEGESEREGGEGEISISVCSALPVLPRWPWLGQVKAGAQTSACSHGQLSSPARHLLLCPWAGGAGVLARAKLGPTHFDIGCWHPKMDKCTRLQHLKSCRIISAGPGESFTKTHSPAPQNLQQISYRRNLSQLQSTLWVTRHSQGHGEVREVGGVFSKVWITTRMIKKMSLLVREILAKAVLWENETNRSEENEVIHVLNGDSIKKTGPTKGPIDQWDQQQFIRQ